MASVDEKKPGCFRGVIMELTIHRLHPVRQELLNGTHHWLHP